MTEIIVSYDKGLCSFITLSGHAGYAEYGKDIVCSGITTATYTSINLIDKISSKCLSLKVDESRGYLHCSLDYQSMDKKDIDFVQLIVKNLIDMYEEIKKDYPKYLKIKILGGCHD